VPDAATSLASEIAQVAPGFHQSWSAYRRSLPNIHRHPPENNRKPPIVPLKSNRRRATVTSGTPSSPAHQRVYPIPAQNADKKRTMRHLASRRGRNLTKKRSVRNAGEAPAHATPRPCRTQTKITRRSQFGPLFSTKPQTRKPISIQSNQTKCNKMQRNATRNAIFARRCTDPRPLPHHPPPITHHPLQ